ncbi:MAG: asparaginase [Burkholderiales bacterium]|nr:asparaginase [Burkholderiales bacterium]
MQVSSNKIVILGTGGTIAGTAAARGDHVGYTAAQLGVAELVASVPALADVPLVAEQVAQLDSKDMDHATWRALALRVAHWLADTQVQGIVVTHGTDTLEETAWFLQQVLQPSKPVVLACAMRPATALVADGPQNLLDAVSVARHPGASGVVAVCAGAIHGAREVRKSHTYRLDAFDSGDAGPIGYVEQGGLRLLRGWPRPLPPQAALLARDAHEWPRVDIVSSHAGADARLVELLVADGTRGLIVAATGNGTVHKALEAALARAQQGGTRVLRATRCAQGRIIASADAAFADADDLSPVKARVSLMLSLGD